MPTPEVADECMVMTRLEVCRMGESAPAKAAMNAPRAPPSCEKVPVTISYDSSELSREVAACIAERITQKATAGEPPQHDA